MSATPASVTRTLRELPGRIREAAAVASDDAALVDLIAEVKSSASRVRTETKLIEAELPANTEGYDWQMKQGRTATRSYNTPSLLSKFGAKIGPNILATLLYLVEQDVIRLSWQWKKLREFADKFNVSLVIAQHEIEDGDPEHDVGEVWGYGYPRYERNNSGV